MNKIQKIIVGIFNMLQILVSMWMGFYSMAMLISWSTAGYVSSTNAEVFGNCMVVYAIYMIVNQLIKKIIRNWKKI